MAGNEAAPDNTLLLLGEMRGQLRELIHNMNKRAQNDELFGRQLAKLESVPQDLKELKGTIEKLEAAHNARLAKLEAAQHRQQGALGSMNWFLKSPLVAWLAAGALAVWAFITGKVGQ